MLNIAVSIGEIFSEPRPQLAPPSRRLVLLDCRLLVVSALCGIPGAVSGFQVCVAPDAPTCLFPSFCFSPSLFSRLRPSYPTVHPSSPPSFSRFPVSLPLILCAPHLRLDRRGPLDCKLGSFSAQCACFYYPALRNLNPLVEEAGLGSSPGRAGRWMERAPEFSLGWPSESVAWVHL